MRVSRWVLGTVWDPLRTCVCCVCAHWPQRFFLTPTPLPPPSCTPHIRSPHAPTTLQVLIVRWAAWTSTWRPYLCTRSPQALFSSPPLCPASTSSATEASLPTFSSVFGEGPALHPPPSPPFLGSVAVDRASTFSGDPGFISFVYTGFWVEGLLSSGELETKLKKTSFFELALGLCD